MLDPRIYRAGLIPVALAVLVLAFSLYDQQGPLGATLAPDAFNGQHAYSTMTRLAKGYPNRRPGSTGDVDVATDVATQLGFYGFTVSTDSFTARTADGTRTLENVIGVVNGFSSRRIVVVTHRDALSSPATADLSGTATLLELGRVLAGRTLNRTIVLASTSGSTGAAGAAQLAKQLGGPVDAVLVLGDLAGTRLRPPVIVPWSNGPDVAPPLLRNTVAAALGAQVALKPGGTSLAGQYAHLAFPLTLSEQGPFGALGQPAVLLSVSGERGPAPGAAVSPTSDRIGAFGRAVLQTISALDAGPAVPAPAAYLLYAGKVVPGWAIRLFVLALILPVLGVAIDGYARARRRGHAVGRWAAWVLGGALPFVLASLAVVGARLTGLIDIAPPGPVGSGAVPMHGSGVALLIGLVCVIAVAFAAVRWSLVRLADVRDEDSSAGGAAAVLLVMCAVSIAIWVTNPFAAGLVVIALNLWVWVVAPDVRLHPLVALALVLAGLAPIVLVAVYYALTLGLGPVELAWNGVLMLAGGHVGLLAALEWSVVLGCAIRVALIAARAARQDRPRDLPVTVRGPVTYAGPGSLGGTKSALRR